MFTAGSVACALATDMIMLILGRALQGIGGGGILPLAQSILADAVAPRERGHYQAYMGSVWVTAGLGGPVIGGILASTLVAIFFAPFFFWLLESASQRFAGKKAAAPVAKPEVA